MNNYLKEFLKISPLSHALWRACEANAFAQVDLKKPILDIGCGFGEFAGVVFNELEMGIDINKKDLLKAKASQKYNKVMLASAVEMPFKSNSYNSVVSVSVLEHISEVEKTLSEVQRILKKNGRFVFTVPTTKLYENLLIPKIANKLKINSVGTKYSEKHKRIFKHVSIYNKNWWRKKLHENGFEIMTEHGTISTNTLYLHEAFLLSALPSEIGKRTVGKRMIHFKEARQKLLAPIFSKYTNLDKGSEINMFYVAKKR